MRDFGLRCGVLAQWSRARCAPRRFSAVPPLRPRTKERERANDVRPRAHDNSLCCRTRVGNSRGEAGGHASHATIVPRTLDPNGGSTLDSFNAQFSAQTSMTTHGGIAFGSKSFLTAASSTPSLRLRETSGQRHRSAPAASWFGAERPRADCAIDFVHRAIGYWQGFTSAIVQL